MEKGLLRNIYISPPPSFTRSSAEALPPPRLGFLHTEFLEAPRVDWAGQKGNKVIARKKDLITTLF